MTKPFGVAELVAHITTLLRPRQKNSKAPEDIDAVEWGNIRLDFKRFLCDVNGVAADLSTREFEILRHFASRPGEVVSREDLLEQAWGYNPENLPSTRTVDNFLVRLRQKLERDPAHPQLLVSVRGAGYRLCVP